MPLDHRFLRPLKGGLLRFNATAATEVFGPGTAKQVVAYDSNLLPQATSLDDSYLSFTTWTDYTPTVSTSSGTFTSTAADGRYKLIGKLLHLWAQLTITTAGTATNMFLTLPDSLKANNDGGGLVGREDASTGDVYIGLTTAGSNKFELLRYDNNGSPTDGYTIRIGGTIEVE